MTSEGKLFVVPTPIGNLKDITFRAIEVLKEVSLILAEDTRTTGKLLKHFQISTPQSSYHQHNEHKVLESLIQRLQSGETIALVSDAGTPAISDPGFLLVRACVQNEIKVECLPGATAFVPALVVSGFPINEFVFKGFLPPKKGRQTALKEIAEEERTVVFYESPHRILKFLVQLKPFISEERKLSISREISKLHETTVTGNIEFLENYFKKYEPKGEFVIILQPESNKN